MPSVHIEVYVFASFLKAGREIVVSGILAQEITENTIFHDWAEKLLIGVFSYYCNLLESLHHQTTTMKTMYETALAI